MICELCDGEVQRNRFLWHVESTDCPGSWTYDEGGEARWVTPNPSESVVRLATFGASDFDETGTRG